MVEGQGELHPDHQRRPETDLTIKVVVGHITTDNGDVQAVTRDVVIKANTTSGSGEAVDDVDGRPHHG